VEALADVAPI